MYNVVIQYSNMFLGYLFVIVSLVAWLLVMRLYVGMHQSHTHAHTLINICNKRTFYLIYPLLVGRCVDTLSPLSLVTIFNPLMICHGSNSCNLKYLKSLFTVQLFLQISSPDHNCIGLNTDSSTACEQVRAFVCMHGCHSCHIESE
jgi:hypothetical protein